MRTACTACRRLAAAMVLGTCALAQADEGDGLKVLQLPNRVRFGIGVEPWRADIGGNGMAPLGGASVLGDYYFSRLGALDGEAGGLRATSGVLLGARFVAWGGPSPAAPAGNPFGFERHNFGLLASGSDRSGADGGVVPYLGLGYSGSSTKGGWGFSADLGLMSLNPGGAARLGRAMGGGPSLEEVLREMRMSPLVQIGASYAF